MPAVGCGQPRRSIPGEALKDYPLLTSIAPTVTEALDIPLPPHARARPLDRATLPGTFFSAQRILILVLDSWGEINWRKACQFTPYVKQIDGRYRIGCLRSLQPSITPVNFTSIGTGATPDVHGVRDRYGRVSHTTIFESASSVGMLSSVVGPSDSSSVLLLGSSADHCLVAQTKADSDAEVAVMLASHLHESGPQLVLAQWLDLDTVGHAHGPLAPEHLETYARTDRLLRHVVPFAQRLGYWILLTADHGMHANSVGADGDRGVHGSDAPEDSLVPLWLIPPCEAL